jgi:hypothetical protein
MLLNQLISGDRESKLGTSFGMSTELEVNNFFGCRDGSNIDKLDL